MPNALSLVQAVVAPVISSASDTFQVRKTLLVGPAMISFIGAAIAPGSSNIYRLIVAQILIGFGFATVPLAYCVPSEILPRRWRPSESTVKDVRYLTLRRLMRMIYSGSGWDERRRCSRCLYRATDDRCSNQGKPPHWMAKLLCTVLGYVIYIFPPADSSTSGSKWHFGG